jgi:hypothetical protein
LKDLTHDRDVILPDAAYEVMERSAETSICGGPALGVRHLGTTTRRNLPGAKEEEGVVVVIQIGEGGRHV